MSNSDWPVPFLLSSQTLQIDAVVTFCVAILVTTMINAEAQAFAATFLGDYRQDTKDRFNFNVFLHLDILGIICYLAGGFGWPRMVDVDTKRFKHPRAYLVITRCVGPLANLLLAGIAGSLVMIMRKFEYDPRVFLLIVGVNITTAVYNLLPIPPLAGGVLVSSLLPQGMDRVRRWFNLIAPYLLVAFLLEERMRGKIPLRGFLDPVIIAIYQYIIK